MSKMKKLGFSMWVIGVGLTFINPDIPSFMVWFIGLCIYFYFDIGNQKEQASIVQESQ